MGGYIFIPFGAFFVCFIANIVLTTRLIRALERHPHVLDMIPGSLMMGWGLHRYVMRDDYLRLGDARLDREVRAYRRLRILTFCCWLVFMVGIFMNMR